MKAVREEEGGPAWASAWKKGVGELTDDHAFHLEGTTDRLKSDVERTG